MERLSEIIPYRTEERGGGCLPVERTKRFSGYSPFKETEAREMAFVYFFLSSAHVILKSLFDILL
jgi:hypothetical protein